MKSYFALSTLLISLSTGRSSMDVDASPKAVDGPVSHHAVHAPGDEPFKMVEVTNRRM